MLDRMKLLASEAGTIPTGRASLHCMKIFDAEVAQIASRIAPIIEYFKTQAKGKVANHLTPSLRTGAAKGTAAALSTARSWGSHLRRTNHHRSPEYNGLHWATYYATIRRDGVFASGTAGPVDMNQELCDPMEKEFSVDWQRTMDSSFRVLLAECEDRVQQVASAVNQAIVDGLSSQGMEKVRLSNLSNTAIRGCAGSVKASFDIMRQLASDTQRGLNRSMLPVIQSKMLPGYEQARNVQRGSGLSYRIKAAIENNIMNSVDSMFNESTTTLVKGIETLIESLARRIVKTGEDLSKHLKNVYSICWDDQSEKNFALNPLVKQKIRECRDKLLPSLNQLYQIQNDALELVGIERREMELDVMAVESLESGLKRKFHEAATKGEVIDLSLSDDETKDFLAKEPHAKPMARVKMEPDRIYSRANI